jgi:hypothetical protein
MIKFKQTPKNYNGPIWKNIKVGNDLGKDTIGLPFLDYWTNAKYQELPNLEIGNLIVYKIHSVGGKYSAGRHGLARKGVIIDIQKKEVVDEKSYSITEYSFIIQCVLKGKSNKLGKTIEFYDRPRYSILTKKLP